jgi:putative aldouronate transport system substrate-binding protein
MYKFKRAVALTVCLMLALVTLLSGCGSGNEDQAGKGATSVSTAEAKTTETTAETTASPNAKEVALSFYLVGTPQKDTEDVSAQLSKLTKEKINATVKLNIIDWGSYDQKMSLMIASENYYDICFTSSWTNNFAQNAAKDAYAPLDELLAKYGQKTLSLSRKEVWDAVKINGKTYASPIFQQNAQGYGISVQAPLVEKYGLDWKNLKGWDDPALDAWFAKIKQSEPDKICFGYQTTYDPFIQCSVQFGLEPISDVMAPGAINTGSSDIKVINQYDTQEFKDYVKRMHDWYDKGYIRKDAATLKDQTADQKVAKFAALQATPDVDSLDWSSLGITSPGIMASHTGGLVKSYEKKFSPTYLSNARATCALLAISKTSENPDRAMQFIELLNTDPKIYNTCAFGREGKDYTVNQNGSIHVDINSGYNTAGPWLFGYMGNAYVPDTSTSAEGAAIGTSGLPKFHEAWIKVNNEAKTSPLLGFVFDTAPVKTEIANCKTVVETIGYSLSSGSVDPEKYLPQFIEKLKTAGSESIIAEEQKQIDAWLKAKK